jgi:hypothetical protein
MTGSERGTRIPTTTWYWAEIEHRKELCTCGHKRGDHAYFMLIGDNSGGCGQRACPCDMYERKK